MKITNLISPNSFCLWIGNFRNYLLMLRWDSSWEMEGKLGSIQSALLVKTRYMRHFHSSKFLYISPSIHTANFPNSPTLHLYITHFKFVKNSITICNTHILFHHHFHWSWLPMRWAVFVCQLFVWTKIKSFRKLILAQIKTSNTPK